MSSSGGSVRLVRTAALEALPCTPEGATEILEACLDGIGGARSLIYIEHQYLSARPVVAALVAALRREPDLEIIVVLNQNADVTAYRAWQTARLVESLGFTVRTTPLSEFAKAEGAVTCLSLIFRVRDRS